MGLITMHSLLTTVPLTAILMITYSLCHVFDPDLSLPYYMTVTRSLPSEIMQIEVAPLQRSRELIPTFKIALKVSWDEPLSSANISAKIKEAWPQNNLNDHQLIKLTDTQMMLLLYRSKHYHKGVLKVKYMARSSTKPVDLFFDLPPPITPGEYHCHLVFKEKLAKIYEDRRIQSDSISFQLRMSASDQIANIQKFHRLTGDEDVDTLQKLVKDVTLHSDTLCTNLARLYHSLAKQLHKMPVKEGDDEYNAQLKAAKLNIPKLPYKILNLNDLRLIQTFILQHQARI